MITEKQWKQFCWDVYDTKRYIRDVRIHDRTISNVDLVDYKITAIEQGFGPTVYTKSFSVTSDYTTLKDLYDSVTVNASMSDIYKLHRKIEE